MCVSASPFAYHIDSPQATGRYVKRLTRPSAHTHRLTSQTLRCERMDLPFCARSTQQPSELYLCCTVTVPLSPRGKRTSLGTNAVSRVATKYGLPDIREQPPTASYPIPPPTPTPSPRQQHGTDTWTYPQLGPGLPGLATRPRLGDPSQNIHIAPGSLPDTVPYPPPSQTAITLTPD